MRAVMSGHPCRRHPRVCGFTLVELLVALSIMAVLALLSWRGVDAMSVSYERTREQSGALSRLQNGLTQWRFDLQSAQSGQGIASPDFDGRTFRILRRNQNPSEPGLIVVAWTVRQLDGASHWLRWQSAPLHTRGQIDQAWMSAQLWANNPNPVLQRQETAIVAAQGWHVFYFRSDAWVNPQSSSSETTAASELPDAIRIQIELSPQPGLQGKLTHDWLRPTLVQPKT